MMMKALRILGCMVLLAPSTVHAQLVELKTTQRAKNMDQKSYRFTGYEQADTVSIRVINPRGELQVMPVINRVLHPKDQVDFRFNTQNWIPGEYHVVVTGKHTQSNDRFKIFATRRD